MAAIFVQVMIWKENDDRQLYYTALTSNVRHSVSTHLRFDNLLNSLFRLNTKKTETFHITGPLWWESTTGYPSKMPVMRKVFPFH